MKATKEKKINYLQRNNNQTNRSPVISNNRCTKTIVTSKY